MYRIFSIDIPPKEDDIANYRSIRLKSLKTNPEAYGSTYEREIAFTTDQWRSRLDAHDRKTFIAAQTTGSTSITETGSIRGEEPREGIWVATASVITPEMLRKAEIELPASVDETKTAVYALVGMWVDPNHRRKGLGRKLIEALVTAVRETKEDGVRSKLILLEVHDENEGARSLYKSLGFTECPGNTEPGQSWMTLFV
ncbi:acyl-CoA N-acyltransferase [Crucibulum laeve]|uniref:Acyl-CoA N-acyltransferase n=1 Tax=Crucibulum laeve TaxID=68775 RepID=A0A5C3LRV2_9AGAR|nr:acyl-CoA N-acyltransferase [Crucibulum laeve]